MTKSTIIGTILLAAFVSACGSDPVPPPQAPTASLAPPPAQPRAQAPLPGQDPTQSTLSIADDIRRACGISEAEAYFAFNSANVRPSDKVVLKKLADCFTTGPLKGRIMRLVGHADPRGEEEYNMALGERRAANVKKAISNEGLKAEQIQTVSRGELDATGVDEASWARDRRVDVTLAN